MDEKAGRELSIRKKAVSGEGVMGSSFGDKFLFLLRGLLWHLK